MTDESYPKDRTALVMIDPFNDFLADGGKLWPMVEPVVSAVGVVDNLKRLLRGAREKGIRVIYAPHRRCREGDYQDFKFRNWSQEAVMQNQAFAAGSWGGEFHDDLKPVAGELVASEHWTASGFANTDLDMILKQHDIERVVLAGMLTNTCVEASGREAAELGYHVTMIKDAVGGLSEAEHTAAVELSYPRFAHAVVDTETFLARVPD